MKNLFRYLVASAAIWTLSTGVVYAADHEYVVDHTGDDSGQACTEAADDCSLRSAMELANAEAAGETKEITFDAALNGSTITLATDPEFFASKLTITGPGAGNLTIDFDGNQGFGFGGGSYQEITDLTLTNASGACISVSEGGGPSEPSLIDSLVIDTCGAEGISLDTGGVSIDNVTISNNTITNLSDEAIAVSADDSTITNIVISGNTITNAQTQGIFINATGGNITGLTISGNDISEVALDAGDQEVIELDGTEDYTIGTVEISDNTLDGTNSESADVISLQYTSDVEITNNSTEGGRHGVGVANTTTVTIAQNDITDPASNGIQTTNATTGILIGGDSAADANTITGAGAWGIFAGCGVGGEVKYNTVTSAGTKGILAAGGNCVINNNTVADSQGVGIHILGTGNTLSGNTITNPAGNGLVLNDYLSIPAINTTVTDLTVTGSGAYAVEISGSGVTGNTISDSTFSSSTSGWVTQSATEAADTNTFTNVSLGNADAYAVTTGVVDVNFKLTVTAQNSETSALVQGVAISATDNVGTVTSLGSTNASGQTVAATLDAYQIDSTGKINIKNPYTFSASGRNLAASLDVPQTTLDAKDDTYTLALASVPSNSGGGGGSGASSSFLNGDDDDDDEESSEGEELSDPIPSQIVEVAEDDDEEEIIEEEEEEESGNNSGGSLNREASEEEKEVLNEATGGVANIIKKVVSPQPQVEQAAPVQENLTEVERLIQEYENKVVNTPVVPKAVRQPVQEEQVSETVTEGIEDTTEKGNIVVVFDEGTGVYEEIVQGTELTIIYGPSHSDSEIAALVASAKEGGKTPVIIDEHSDYDNDYVSDVLAIQLGLPLFDPDSDNDGFTNAEELFLGFDPAEFNEAPSVPAITNLDGQTVDPWPSVRLRGAIGDEVEVTLVAANGDEIVIGTSEIDEKYKGEIHLEYPIPDGVYYGVPRGKDGIGEIVKFTVDSGVALKAPKITGVNSLDLEKRSLLRLGYVTGMVIDQLDVADEDFDGEAFIASHDPFAGSYIIRGYAEPGQVVYLAAKSVIFSSVVLSDASGYFETIVYDEDFTFGDQDHTVLGYATSEDGRTNGEVSVFPVSRIQR